MTEPNSREDWERFERFRLWNSPPPAACYILTPTPDEILEDAWQLWLEVVNPFRVEFVMPPLVYFVTNTQQEEQIT